MSRPPTRERLQALPVRVADWHFNVLCKMAQRRGVSLGEVLRAILNQVFEKDRPVEP